MVYLRCPWEKVRPGQRYSRSVSGTLNSDGPAHASLLVSYFVWLEILFRQVSVKYSIAVEFYSDKSASFIRHSELPCASP